MISLNGRFVKYIYQNIDNDFSVAIFKLDSDSIDGISEISPLSPNITISIKSISIEINKSYVINVTPSKSNKYKDSFELVNVEKKVIDPKILQLII
ncbi:MAG: hypothetical protein ACRC1F_01710 [Metamycoplasmataceae bacterium]